MALVEGPGSAAGSAAHFQVARSKAKSQSARGVYSAGGVYEGGVSSSHRWAERFLDHHFSPSSTTRNKVIAAALYIGLGAFGAVGERLRFWWTGESDISPTIVLKPWVKWARRLAFPFTIPDAIIQGLCDWVGFGVQKAIGWKGSRQQDGSYSPLFPQNKWVRTGLAWVGNTLRFSLRVATAFTVGIFAVGATIAAAGGAAIFAGGLEAIKFTALAFAHPTATGAAAMGGAGYEITAVTAANIAATYATYPIANGKNQFSRRPGGAAAKTWFDRIGGFFYEPKAPKSPGDGWIVVPSEQSKSNPLPGENGDLGDSPDAKNWQGNRLRSGSNAAGLSAANDIFIEEDVAAEERVWTDPGTTITAPHGSTYNFGQPSAATYSGGAPTGQPASGGSGSGEGYNSDAEGSTSPRSGVDRGVFPGGGYAPQSDAVGRGVGVANPVPTATSPNVGGGRGRGAPRARRGGHNGGGE